VADADQVPSTRPYLIRALYDWCVDNGFTPYLSVAVDGETRVPSAFVKDGQITLNVSVEATQNLVLGNEAIQFAARFGGVATNISVPVGRVLAVYARENGVGMGFPILEVGENSDESPTSVADDGADTTPPSAPESLENSESTEPSKAGKRDRPSLKRIK
jgi:stringent starvation protein B